MVYTAYNSDFPSIEYLVKTAQVKVNQKIKGGSTALMVALRFTKDRKPDIAIIACLVNADQADVTIGNDAGDTPLFRILRMVKKNKDVSKYEDHVLKIVKILVTKEQSIVTQGDSGNFTPLMSKYL